MNLQSPDKCLLNCNKETINLNKSTVYFTRMSFKNQKVQNGFEDMQQKLGISG